MMPGLPRDGISLWARDDRRPSKSYSARVWAALNHDMWPPKIISIFGVDYPQIVRDLTQVEDFVFAPLWISELTEREETYNTWGPSDFLLVDAWIHLGSSIQEKIVYFFPFDHVDVVSWIIVVVSHRPLLATNIA